MEIGKALKRIISDDAELSRLSFVDEAYLSGRLDKSDWFNAKLAMLSLKFEALEKTKKELALLDNANTIHSHV